MNKSCLEFITINFVEKAAALYAQEIISHLNYSNF